MKTRILAMNPAKLLQTIYTGCIHYQLTHSISLTSHLLRSAQNALTNVDDKTRQINLCFAMSEEKIFTAAKDALAQLRMETDVKLAQLEAVEAELLRRNSGLHQMLTYFDLLRASSKTGSTDSKVTFLQIYKSHLDLIAELSGSSIAGGGPTAAIRKELAVLAEVKDDIHIDASIAVFVGEDKSRQNQSQSQSQNQSHPPTPPTLGKSQLPEEPSSSSSSAKNPHHYVHEHKTFTPNKHHVHNQNDDFFQHSHSPTVGFNPDGTPVVISPQHKYLLHKTQPKRVNHSTYSKSTSRRASVAPHSKLKPKPPPVSVNKHISPTKNVSESVYDKEGEAGQEVSERSERALTKTRIPAMNPAKWLQTKNYIHYQA